MTDNAVAIVRVLTALARESGRGLCWCPSGTMAGLPHTDGCCEARALLDRCVEDVQHEAPRRAMAALVACPRVPLN